MVASILANDMDHYIHHVGCALHYAVRGHGPAVLFIQGVGVHGDGWLPQVEALSGRYRCVTFDNRGMGRSQPIGTARLCVEQMADDARAVMDATGVESAHVVGHSLGGLIALELALAHRARVRSLALLCTFARGWDATALSGRMLWLGLRSNLGPRRWRRRAFLEIVLPPDRLRAERDLDGLAERLASLFGHDLAVQPPIAMKQLQCMRPYDASGRLRELAGLPTLVVTAEHDPIARPVYGQALATGIPGAIHTHLKDASHGAPLHSPEVISGLLRDHLGTVEGGLNETGASTADHRQSR